MTWTVINVILVDVLGIEKLAKGVALFYLFTELATLVSVPISGEYHNIDMLILQYRHALFKNLQSAVSGPDD